MDIFLALEKLERALAKNPRNPFEAAILIHNSEAVKARLCGLPNPPSKLPSTEEAFLTGVKQLRLILIEEIKIIKSLASEERVHNLDRNAAE